jgi:hypothetical protein
VHRRLICKILGHKPKRSVTSEVGPPDDLSCFVYYAGGVCTRCGDVLTIVVEKTLFTRGSEGVPRARAQQK